MDSPRVLWPPICASNVPREALMEAFDVYSPGARSHSHDCQHVLDRAPSENQFLGVEQILRNVLNAVRSAINVCDDLVAASGAIYSVILPVAFTKFCIV